MSRPSASAAGRCAAVRRLSSPRWPARHAGTCALATHKRAERLRPLFPTANGRNRLRCSSAWRKSANAARPYFENRGHPIVRCVALPRLSLFCADLGQDLEEFCHALGCGAKRRRCRVLGVLLFRFAPA